MISNYYGNNISLAKSRELLHIDNNGCSVWAIVSAASNLGMKAEAIGLEDNDAYEELTKLKINGPCIANIITKEGLSHFVIIEKIGKKINLIDPGKGRLKMDYDLFVEIWTGVIIIFSAAHLKVCNDKKYTYVFFKRLFVNNVFLIAKMAFFSLLSSVTSILQIFLIQSMLNDLLHGSEHHHNFVIVSGETTSLLIKFFTGNKIIYAEFFVICVMKFIFKICYEYRKNDLSCDVDTDIFELLFEKTTRLPYVFFETRRTGEVVSRFEEIYKVRNSFVGIVKNVFCDALIIFVLNVFVAFKYKEMLGIEFILLIVYSFLLCVENNTLNSKIQDALMKKESLFSHITKCYSAIVDFVYGRNVYNKNVFYKKQSESTKNLKNTSDLSALFDSFESFITDICPAMIIVCGHMVLLGKEYVVSEYVVSFFLLMILMGYFRSFCRIVLNLMTFSNSVERLEDILEAKEKSKFITTKYCKDRLIVFNDVSFAYGYRKPTLKGVSFEIRRGEAIAFVGESGSGKSTIIKMIMNYSNNIKGEINRGTNQISCINQESCIYNDSIRRNILLDRDDISEECFAQICKIAKVDKIANMRPRGYETIMDEKGTDFSMGEKQRIIFARVLLERPELLIIDEAGNSIDSVNEVEILRDIRKAYKEMAIVVITHRISTVKMCDRIYMLEDGTISDYGTHDELKTRNMEYNRLCSDYC